MMTICSIYRSNHIAMLANLKKPNDQGNTTPKKPKNANSKGKSNKEDKNNKAPPFASQPGKEGDTKEFN